MILVIIGAGGYGQTICDVAEQSGKYERIVFLDDNKVADNVVGKCDDFEKFISDDTEIYPAFGNNQARLSFIEKLEENGANIPIIVHKTAYISPKARLEKGTVVLPNAMVNTDTVVEKGCIINCGAIVDHGCIIEKGVHVCLGAVVKAENRIPAFMKVEAGQVIENRTYKL
ncbi:MAG: hypothetical protein E7600_03370 [Ruminococcaceae bacterium]|nr:hypothetical protein [Oscillospiraceae bacterium]